MLLFTKYRTHCAAHVSQGFNLRQFQNFSFWNCYLKNSQFCRLQAEKLQKPLLKKCFFEKLFDSVCKRVYDIEGNLLFPFNHYSEEAYVKVFGCH
jgi:hypothetical protein